MTHGRRANRDEAERWGQAAREALKEAARIDNQPGYRYMVVADEWIEVAIANARRAWRAANRVVAS